MSNIFQSSVSHDVVFGISPALTAVYVAENVTVNQQMTMDIFFPVGDALPKRPAVILAYGGGYLFGTKEDEDVWATCDSLAKKGYVTASINYRMNMNVADPSSAVRAIYRAAQDYSSALRYLKEFSDPFGIDTNYIFVGGVSAGGFSAMHMAFLDENERPSETYQGGLLGQVPDLGCLSCAGNSYQHSHEVRGIINLWGALMDTSYIQQDELVPMTLFHGTNDLIVPYDYGFPFTALFLMPEVYGSANIAARVDHLGGNAELNTFDGVGHNIWGVNVNNQLVGGPTEYWVPITDSIVSFLYENIRPEQPLMQASNPVCDGDTITLIITNMPQNGTACWTVDEGNIVGSNSDSSSIGVVWQAEGIYTVEAVVTNHLGAISVSNSINVIVNPIPTVSISEVEGLLMASGNYSVYRWYLNGTELVGESSNSIEPTQTGTYSVEAFNEFGCSAISDQMTVVSVPTLTTTSPNVAFVISYDLCGRIISDADYEGLMVQEFYGFNRELIARKKVYSNPSGF